MHSFIVCGQFVVAFCLFPLQKTIYFFFFPSRIVLISCLDTWIMIGTYPIYSCQVRDILNDASSSLHPSIHLQSGVR